MPKLDSMRRGEGHNFKKRKEYVGVRGVGFIALNTLRMINWLDGLQFFFLKN